MSQTERHTGRLICAELDGTIEEQCKHMLDVNNHPVDPFYEGNFIEQFEDEFYKNYIIFNGNVYLMVDKKEDDSDDIYDMKRDDKDSLVYTVKYYNGGMGHTEALENAYKRMIEREQL